ncbi:peptidase [Saccharopolyspora montiporae]|uniref:peptidase n=1 Tax=Saccharopolyspora montiporae TaxID=2781240 RepID=UPI00351C388C
MRLLGLATGMIALVTAVTACSPAPQAPPPVLADPVDPGFVQGTDHGADDQLAATVVHEVQRYWSATFPEVAATGWHDLGGGVFSVDTADPSATAPPCTSGTDDVEGNAFYCATADAIAWDRAALLPVLREHYGDAAVAVVLAHEFGHAVQHRAGSDDAAAGPDPALLEAGADCYAGGFLRWVADGRSPHLRVDSGQLDGALRALTVFQDPLTDTGGTEHGSSFERVAAFQDGYQRGPDSCTSPAADVPGGTPGEVPARDLDRVLADDRAADFIARLTGSPPPRVVPVRAAPEECARQISAVAYCPDPPTVAVDRAALQDVHSEDGPHAAETQLASRYAAAALQRSGAPTTGAAAGERITCLTGAFTTDRDDLTRVELDEAVRAVLHTGSVSRDAGGTNHLGGFDRMAAFRAGATGGPQSCDDRGG